MAYSNSPGDILGDYSQLRTIPALLGIFFALASLYQFGGVSTLDFTWISYSLTAQHAMLVSLGAFVIAFASSETQSFEYYERWEQVVIAAGPLLILAHQYIPAINNLIVTNSPVAGALAFILSVASWGVAVR